MVDEPQQTDRRPQPAGTGGPPQGQRPPRPQGGGGGGGRRDQRRGGRPQEHEPRTIERAPTKPKKVKPITKAQEEGKEPMRSFSDLMQLFDKKKQKPDEGRHSFPRIADSLIRAFSLPSMPLVWLTIGDWLR